MIENEIVSAGANTENKNVVLLYGQYNPNGSLELKVNAKDPKDAEHILSLIKKNFT